MTTTRLGPDRPTTPQRRCPRLGFGELGRHIDHNHIAMEGVLSRDLRTILDKRRANGTLMPTPEAAFLTSKICDALDYAHRKRDPTGQPMNIIHRDVSPQNGLVGFEGEVIDFSIAKEANRAPKTQAGVFQGKCHRCETNRRSGECDGPGTAREPGRD